jgi:hypothetical protein
MAVQQDGELALFQVVGAADIFFPYCPIYTSLVSNDVLASVLYPE